MTVRLNVSRNSAGSITGATANFQASLTGFPAGTALTMAHIHAGAAGANGDIVVNAGLTAGEVSLVNGGGSFTKNGISVSTDAATNFANAPFNFYFNVHSALNPNGVARGQLFRQ